MWILISACGVISTAIAILCCIPYWRSVIQGRTKPHQFSWIIFFIMNFIVTLSQFLEGARYSVLISFTFLIGSFVNVVLSFKYGTRDTSNADRWLFAFSLVTIGIWVLTKNNVIAIWLTVVIDVFATAMILLKIRTQPNSEAAFPWLLASIAFIFTIITLAETPLSSLYIRPIYGLLSDLAVVAAVVYYRRRTLVLSLSREEVRAEVDEMGEAQPASIRATVP